MKDFMVDLSKQGKIPKSLRKKLEDMRKRKKKDMEKSPDNIYIRPRLSKRQDTRQIRDGPHNRLAENAQSSESWKLNEKIQTTVDAVSENSASTSDSNRTSQVLVNEREKLGVSKNDNDISNSTMTVSSPSTSPSTNNKPTKKNLPFNISTRKTHRVFDTTPYKNEEEKDHGSDVVGSSGDRNIFDTMSEEEDEEIAFKVSERMRSGSDDGASQASSQVEIVARSIVSNTKTCITNGGIEMARKITIAPLGPLSAPRTKTRNSASNGQDANGATKSKVIVISSATAESTISQRSTTNSQTMDSSEVVVEETEKKNQGDSIKEIANDERAGNLDKGKKNELFSKPCSDANQRLGSKSREHAGGDQFLKVESVDVCFGPGTNARRMKLETVATDKAAPSSTSNTNPNSAGTFIIQQHYI